MSELEKLFKENKESFNRLEPKSEWLDIKDRISSDEVLPRTKGYAKILSIAAVFVVIVGLAGFYFVRQGAQVTTEFQSLTLLSPEGTPTALVPGSNEYTLVQFWASGNAICSEENCYYYLPAYEKYKNKGFEIYAISLDENKEDWLAGIEENDLPWIHVSDLQGLESPLCVECNITKVPTSFLLNKKGEIIARDLDAPGLIEKLDVLLADN